MSIRTMTEDDWRQVWPFFNEIVQAGETYAYPLDLTSAQAQALMIASGGAATSSASDPSRSNRRRISLASVYQLGAMPRAMLRPSAARRAARVVPSTMKSSKSRRTLRERSEA